MNRQQKESVVADFKKLFSESQCSFLVNYRGLNVVQMQSFRKNLRETGGVFKITKARLLKIAAQNLANEVEGITSFKEDFHDQIGIVFSQDNTPALAKKIVDFSKDNEQLKIISGLFEAKVLTKEEIVSLASLPSKDVLLSMLARTMQEPISGFARALNAVILDLAYAIQQIGEKKDNE